MEISILIVTYNHEKYIEQALDSVLMQKIDVPYEILILDDASSDHTPEILKQYKEKHPQNITLYLRKTNSGSPTRNGYFLLSKAKGKYFTFLEGDDYWIAPLKIQKQYDFLSKHKEYSGCMTEIKVVDENDTEIEEQLYEKKENRIFTMEDFRNLKEPGLTASFFARNYFDKEEFRILYEADKMMGDITTYMLCLLRGDIYQMDEVMTAYRYVCVKGEGNFNSIHQENIYRNYIQMRYWIRLENYMRKYDKKFEFIPFVDIIDLFGSRYPVRIMLRLLAQSENRKKYIVVYFIQRFLLDSKYLLSETRCRNMSEKYNWSAFYREKKPIVLFGSGAVAEEYIDKYAWKGNILFLVDNNKKRHNTSLKGFLIKNPDELLNYKGKVNVLITNKNNEKEIEEQLRNMEIRAYYCYCSMQSRRLRNIIASRLMDIIR
ncbi:glycosyltransferase [Lachnospiraceae bacterium 48-42]